jgi:hypothetical protein
VVTTDFPRYGCKILGSGNHIQFAFRMQRQGFHEKYKECGYPDFKLHI